MEELIRVSFVSIGLICLAISIELALYLRSELKRIERGKK